MMASVCATTNANHLVRNCKATLYLKGVRRFTLRLWLGVKAINLGAKIIGMKFGVVEIEDKPRNEPEEKPFIEYR